VVFGGIHATLYPEEAFEHGAAHAAVKGDGDLVWGQVIADCLDGKPLKVYDGGRVSGENFVKARWDLMKPGRYMWASVQTVRGCPKHCSFCSVWRTDGQKPRQRGTDAVVEEILQLRRLGYRYIALADDNFYPVSLEDLRLVTAEGLKAVYKDFNLAGEGLVQRLRTFKEHGVHVLGSFIFGLPTDRHETFEATAALAKRADLTFAQFVTMTPFPGTVDFDRWEKTQGKDVQRVEGVPVTRYWLIPGHLRPKVYSEHPTMTPEEIRLGTQGAWDSYYSMREIWRRANCVRSLKARIAFVFISKLYRQMYANTGIATDSARRTRANRWARMMAIVCRRLFAGKPMPELQMPPSEQGPFRIVGA
jgi:radical SAM superfamily enzyme YgiQ (UPF0313 family)